MLVLGRREGEAILIGDEIEVVITRIDKNKVRVGIKAPQEIEIRRPEQLASNRAPSAHHPRRGSSSEKNVGEATESVGVAKAQQRRVVIDTELPGGKTEEQAA
jgi:carbon storage regulator CsrA